MGYATVEQAIRAKFATDVATPSGLTVIYDNAPPTDLKQTWCRAAIVVASSEQVHGGGTGRRRFRVIGSLEVALYAPSSKGDATLAALVDTVVTVFTAAKITSPLVEFTPPPSPTSPPERDEAWWRRTVSVPFQFDYLA